MFRVALRAATSTVRELEREENKTTYVCRNGVCLNHANFFVDEMLMKMSMRVFVSKCIHDRNAYI